MILRLGSGWQTVTADLALILFMVTAQAIQQPSPDKAKAAAASASSSGHAQPKPADVPDMNVASGTSLAIFRPGTGTDLGQWLTATLTDERQTPTVYIRYRPGERDGALAQGAQLLGEIGRAGHAARLVVEPSRQAGVIITVGFTGSDTDGTNVAGPNG